MTNPKLSQKPLAQKNESLQDSQAHSSLDDSMESTGHALDETQAFMDQTLSELDYIQSKEKRISADQVEQATARPTLQSALPKPKLASGAEKLLGILGHCSLPGHIAHFYNMQSEIERHIRTIADLGDEKFVAAYKYLKANPSTEAVFVYESKMVAANRINGRLIQKNIIAS